MQLHRVEVEIWSVVVLNKFINCHCQGTEFAGSGSQGPVVVNQLLTIIGRAAWSPLDKRW